MSSEILGGAENVLKGNLGGAWDIKHGYADAYTDLGIGRRFGGAAAAYSLRDIGAMNEKVVNVRREIDDPDGETNDPEQTFSANQVQNGALEDWINGKLEKELPNKGEDVDQAFSLRKVVPYGVAVDGDFSNAFIATAMGAALISRDTDSLTFNFGTTDALTAVKTRILSTQFNPGGQITISGATGTTAASVNTAHDIASSTTNTITITISGLNTAISGGASDPATQSTIKVNDPNPDDFSGITNSTLLAGQSAHSKSNLLKYELAADSFTVTGNAASIYNQTYTLNAANDRWESELYPATYYYFKDGSDWKLFYAGQDITASSSGTFPYNSTWSSFLSGSNFNTNQTQSVRLSWTDTTYKYQPKGYIEFEYYVSANNPIIGNYWYVGANADNVYSDIGVEIVGEAWTTARIYFDNKPATDLNTGVDADGSFRFLTILNKPTKAHGGKEGIIGNLGDIIYLSSVKTRGSNDRCMHIRRSSDNLEAAVLFDSEGKVSASSLVADINESTAGSSQASGAPATLSDFLNPGGVATDAFIVVWYNQAVSNYTQFPLFAGAYQLAAANQPQIASSGSLLADGVDFNGSSHYLDSASALGATSTIGAFIVHKSDDTDENQYLLDNRDADNDGMQIMQIDSGDGAYRFSMDNTDVDSASGSVTTSETLLTAIQSSTAATLFKNAVQQATDADDAINVTAAFRIGANRVSTGTYFDGTMKEIILFTSDQTDNRFKIESNINNYYSLYNDENELSAAFSSNGTITNASKTGFTADVPTFSHYVNATFNNSVASGESIYTSFNVQLAPNGGTAANPVLRLQNSQTGSNTSNQSSVTEGFNSIRLVATGASDRVGFIEQEDNVDYIISDFKVSRIARNGFVESLYDQSGNGRTMAQTTAADQPHIVENGGICKDPSGNNPTVKFVNVGTNSGSTFMTATPIAGGQNPFTYLFVASSTNTGASGQTFIGSGAASGVDLRLSTLAIRMRSGNTNRTTSSNTLTSNTNSLLTYIRASGRVPKMALNNNALETESATPDAGSDEINEIMGENSTSASSDSFGLVGTISESILYTSDKDAASELTDLKNNLNNYYNLF